MKVDFSTKLKRRIHFDCAVCAWIWIKNGKIGLLYVFASAIVVLIAPIEKWWPHQNWPLFETSDVLLVVRHAHFHGDVLNSFFLLSGSSNILNRRTKWNRLNELKWTSIAFKQKYWHYDMNIKRNNYVLDCNLDTESASIGFQFEIFASV